MQKRGPILLVLSSLRWLAIGAAVTVAIAWLGAEAARREWTRRAVVTLAGRDHVDVWFVQEPSVWLTTPPSIWPSAPDSAWRSDGLCWTAIGASHGWMGVMTQDYFSQIEDQFGLPTRALRNSAWDERVHGTVSAGSSVGIPMFWSPKPNREFRLPLVPIWPGFALNTLFYAAIAWGLWQVPMYLRRRHRRAHNRCTRCGYSLAGLTTGAACPECGHP